MFVIMCPRLGLPAKSKQIQILTTLAGTVRNCTGRADALLSLAAQYSLAVQ